MRRFRNENRKSTELEARSSRLGARGSELETRSSRLGARGSELEAPNLGTIDMYLPETYKIEFLVKNWNFDHKSKFLTKNRHFRPSFVIFDQKSKFLAKNLDLNVLTPTNDKANSTIFIVQKQFEARSLVHSARSLRSFKILRHLML